MLQAFYLPVESSSWWHLWQQVLMLLLLLLVRLVQDVLWVTMLSQGLQQARRVGVVQPCLGTEPLWEGYAALLQGLLPQGMLTKSVQRLLWKGP